MLHAASAGKPPVSAATNSPWMSAALRADLTDVTDVPVGPLPNTLAVENLVDTGPPAFAPGCLAASSNRGGNIAAVGTDVFSHLLGSAPET